MEVSMEVAAAFRVTRYCALTVTWSVWVELIVVETVNVFGVLSSVVAPESRDHEVDLFPVVVPLPNIPLPVYVTAVPVSYQ